MQKYWGILKNYFATELEYRSNLVGLMIVELLGVGSILFLWLGIFKDVDQIGGYSLDQTVLYYLLVPVVGFVTQVKISGTLGYEIKDGILSNYLLKPYKIYGFSLMRVIAIKSVLLLFTIPIYSLVIYVHQLTTGTQVFSWHSILMAVILLISALGLHFILDIGLSWLAFWVDDIWSIEHFKTIFIGLMGGVSFPLDFMPASWQQVFEFLPFKYFYYVPIEYLLGMRSTDAIGKDLLHLFIWTLVFWVFGSLLWKKGLTKYEAYGR